MGRHGQGDYRCSKQLTLKHKMLDVVKWSTSDKLVVDLYGDSKWKESLVKWER